jgi:hypothetical protein
VKSIPKRFQDSDDDAEDEESKEESAKEESNLKTK